MPTHSVQILYVNTSPPMGTDKQVNITGIEMQKDFWCVDVLIQYVTFPLHHQSDVQICCTRHTSSPSRPKTSLSKKPAFSGQTWKYKKNLSRNLKYFGPESKYFFLGKLHPRHRTPATDILPTRTATVPPVSYTCHSQGPSFLTRLSDLLWQVLPMGHSGRQM